MLFLSTLSLLSLLVPSISAIVIPKPSPTIDRRAQVNPTPGAAGDPTNGWQNLPATPNGGIHPTWGIEGADFPLYQSSGRTKSNIKRAVIVLPAKHRDCWNYFNLVNNALLQASESFGDVNEDEVSIMAPCFLIDVDRAGAASDNTMLFGATTWASGQKASAPSSVDSMSSYEVLDRLIAHYTNTAAYPNLRAVVIAGHSLGGQMAQRYAALRTPTDSDDRIHYWIANPGSLLWLTEDRPSPDASCTDYDKFKYGLSGGFPAYATSTAKTLGREGIVERYRGRNVHYAWGTADTGNGDTRCQAYTQGSSHLQRGQQFIDMLGGMDGGIPSATTIDWVEGVSHIAADMISSSAGVDKLFRFPFYD